MNTLPVAVIAACSGALAPEAEMHVPPMDERDAFIEFSARRFGDAEAFAAARWDSARRLIADGDFLGFAGGRESAGSGPGGSVREFAGGSRSTAMCRTLAAYLLTPREAFIPEHHRSSAYSPVALPLGHDQTISAPYMVTRMTSAAAPELPPETISPTAPKPAADQRILEIGTGSGYQAAMLAALSGNVRTIEYVGPLAAQAGETFDHLAERRGWLGTIRRRTGSGYAGWDEGAPYHRIIVTCAIDHPPPALLDQLAPGGILILPLGSPGLHQTLAALRRRREGEDRPPGISWQPAEGLDADAGHFDITDLYGDGTRVVFVPFVH